MATLERIPVMQGDIPRKAEGLTNCQWCNKQLQSEDTIWECVGRLDHYLVCDTCHEAATIH